MKIGRSLELRRLMNRTDMDCHSPGGELSFQGCGKGERKFKDDAEKIGSLSEDAGRTEVEAEDKEQGKAGCPQGLTAWMMKAGHGFPGQSPLQALMHGR